MALTVNKQRTHERDRTQRSRGFLYASLGVAAAAALKVREVLASDNGHVSVGLPINGQVLGSMASRTTHPRFLFLMNRLVAKLDLETRLRIPSLEKNAGGGPRHPHRQGDVRAAIEDALVRRWSHLAR